MNKFGRSEEMRLLPRIVGTEDVKIGFDSLIGSFSLSVSLGLISGGETDVIFKESC